MRMSFFLSGLAALVVVATAQAQTRPPTQNQIQQRPPQTATQAAQTTPQPNAVQPAQAAQNNFYPTPIYRMNDVTKSLNLTPEQVTQLNQVTEQTQGRYRDNYGKLDTLKPEERFSRQYELNQQYNTDWMKGANSILNDNQRKRYQQLNYQYGGFSSLADPTVQKQLNLTGEQQRNLRESIDWSNQQRQEIERQAASDPTKATQAYQDYQKQYQERFNKFLTPEQGQSWRTMTGETYNFQPAFTTRPNR